MSEAGASSSKSEEKTNHQSQHSQHSQHSHHTEKRKFAQLQGEGGGEEEGGEERGGKGGEERGEEKEEEKAIRGRVSKLCRRAIILDESLHAMSLKRARHESTIIFTVEIYPHDVEKKEQVHGTESFALSFFCPLIGRTELSTTIPAIPTVVRDFIVGNNVTVNAGVTIQLYWPRPPIFTFAGNGIPATSSTARQFVVRNAAEETSWTFHFKTASSPRGLLTEISFVHDSAEHPEITQRMLQFATDNNYTNYQTLCAMRFKE